MSVSEERRVSPVLRRVVVGALDTNCWILHPTTDRHALVVDPGDDPDAILAATADLDVVAVVLTHAHFDHVLALPGLLAAWDVPVLAHPADAPVWPHELDTLRRTGHWDAGTSPALLAPRPGEPLWDGGTVPVEDGEMITVGPLRVQILHTPGHTPGGLSLLVDGDLLTGDTLFPGGPGLTGPPLSDFPTIIGSVRRLLELPGHTRIHPGHGGSTTVDAQRPCVDGWAARGW